MGLADSKWVKKIQGVVRRFKVGLEDRKWDHKFQRGLRSSRWGQTIQSGIRRFKVGLED